MKFLYYALLLLIPHGLLAMEKTIEEEISKRRPVAQDIIINELTTAKLKVESMQAKSQKELDLQLGHALDCAARYAYNKTIPIMHIFDQASALLTHGANINFEGVFKPFMDEPELFLLHFILYPHIVTYLLSHGVDVNKANSVTKQTALHNLFSRNSQALHVCSDSFSIAQNLLANGASMQVQDCKGKTPLMINIDAWKWEQKILTGIKKMKLPIDCQPINPSFRIKYVTLCLDESKRRLIARQAKQYFEAGPKHTYFALVHRDFRENLLLRYRFAEPLDIFVKDLKGQTALDKAKLLRSTAEADQEEVAKIDQLIALLEEYSNCFLRLARNSSMTESRKT